MLNEVKSLNRPELEIGQRLLFACETKASTAQSNGAADKSKQRRASAIADAAAEELATKIIAAITSLGERLESRIDAVEDAVQKLCEELVTANVTKEFYTTAEVAKILGKRPYTVREWCRLGRVNGQKAFSGRGLDEEWRIPHAEMMRIQNEGLLEPKRETQLTSAARIKHPR